jgi:hypothetical protein
MHCSPSLLPHEITSAAMLKTPAEGQMVAGSQAFRGHLAGRSVVNVWATKNHAPAAIAPPQMTFYPIGRIPKGARFL